MTYQLADGWIDRELRAPSAWPGGTARRRRGAGGGAWPGCAGRNTHGHRFEAAVSPIVLRDADSYAEQLHDEGAVIAGFAERRAEIVRQLQAAADRAGPAARSTTRRCSTRSPAWSSGPTCWPASSSAQFLAVPQRVPDPDDEGQPEVLSAGRRRRQADATASWSSATSGRPTPAASIEGNERVVRPRLADAKFFFDQDRKKTLESRVPALAKVVYHGKLGTQGERVERVRSLAARHRRAARRPGAGRTAPTAPRCWPRPIC